MKTKSQGEFNNWYFGNYKSVTFNSGIPLLQTNSPMLSAGTTVNVSDSVGSILFYCNGDTVYNRLNAMMPHGDSLFGSSGSFSQTVEVVQSPGDENLYYLFTPATLIPPGPNILHPTVYSVLDMRLDGGLGDIDPTRKNIPLPFAAGTAFKTVTGTRHGNNRDAWIVFRLLGPDSNFYASYRVSSSGIDTLPVLSPSLVSNVIKPPINDPANKFLRISPDGHNLICLYYTDTMEVCHFNDMTGQVIPRFRYHSAGGMMTSAEFSIDSKLLYTGYGNNALYQYDILAPDSASFAQSPIEVGTTTSIAHSAMQMGPDGKIYGTRDITPYLWVVNYPSVRGTGCGFNATGFNLTNPSHTDGLPQFIQRYKAFIHNNGQCSGDTVQFSGDIWPPPDSLHWDFGDPASGAANVSTLVTPFHVYQTGGMYTVTLFVRHNDMRTDSVWRTVTILSGPSVNLGSDRYVCPGDSATFNAGTCAGCLYQWDNVTLGILNIGSNQTYRTNQPGIYAVTVTGPNGCNGRDTIQLFTTPIPVITNTTFLDSICTGDSTHIALYSSVPNTVFHWTPSLTSGNINGFSADSGQIIRQVLVNHLAIPGIVTYHVTPKVGSCTGTPVDFQEKVFPGDSVKVSISASSNNICPGTQVTYSATPTNPGTSPFYQWKVNGLNVGPNSPNYSYNPLNGDQVKCVMTSSILTCIANNPATSNTITMTVNPNLPVSVTVSPSANNVCSGTLTTFTANPTNPGSTPIYQWKVNGLIMGTNSPTYSYIPLNNDAITCKLTSSETCTSGNPSTSPTVIMVVNQPLAVGNSISASSNPFCIGSNVIFTATPSNQGTSPVYQWKVNGINSGSNNLTFSYNPVSGDLVTCTLTSSEPCTSSNPATSNPISMIGNLGQPAGVSITANPNPFCPGTAVTFTATPTNGGTNPSYQWKVNGANAGTNSPTFIYNPANNDSVRCVMTSNLACVSGNPASSAKIIMNGTLAPVVTFTTCFDTITTLNAKPIKLKGGIPLNGTYSGPGVTANIFNPATAGVGNKTITYTYTNVALCSASKTKIITVLSNPAFTCGNNLTDIRDGKSYSTVQIGSQCWMSANLNYGTMISGGSHQRDNCVNEKYCYNDLTANCGSQSYYQWDELMRYDDTPGLQGLCPPGWHVPSESEWQTLFVNWTNSGFAGSPLKYSGYSGFNALLSGVRHQNVQWDFQNFATLFWTSTPNGPYKAFAHGMNDYNPSVSLYTSSRANAFSIRCLRD